VQSAYYTVGVFDFKGWSSSTVEALPSLLVAMAQTLDYVLTLQALFAPPALAWMLLLQSAFELYDDGAHFKSVFLSMSILLLTCFAHLEVVEFLQTAWENKKPKWVEWSVSPCPFLAEDPPVVVVVR